MQSILLVDDDPIIHLLLKAALKDEQYDLVFALTAEEATQKLLERKVSFSAIISDWMLPGMLGIDLLKWLKRDTEFRNIPVIMLTSIDSKDHIKRGLVEGAYYYLTKPFNREILKSIVNAAITEYVKVLSLYEEIKKGQNPFKNLQNGVFRIKSFEEGEKLSVWIANVCTNPEGALIISELICNAVEHGNLDIGYEEKTKLINDNLLRKEIDRRLLLPENKDKYVQIDFKKEDAVLVITIEDQGKGFDYNKYLYFDESRVFDNHGRGIAMANSYLNIKYIDNGSKVIVKVLIDNKKENNS